MAADDLAAELLLAVEDEAESLLNEHIPLAQQAEVLIDQLYDEPVLVVIDDAHLLQPLTLAWLRHLYWQPNIRIALIGRPSLIERLPARFCRQARSIRLYPLHPQSVASTVRRLHPIYANAASETLISVNARYAHGNLGRWAMFTRHAAAVCSVEGLPALTTRVAADVVSHLELIDAAH
jgi:hypothetical protein